MEDLIELVAASFARHGIESPVGDPQLVWGQPPPAVQAERSSASPHPSTFSPPLTPRF
jgi:hypothetical protein